MNGKLLIALLLTLSILAACGDGQETGNTVGEAKLEAVQQTAPAEQTTPAARGLNPRQGELLQRLATEGTIPPKPINLDSRVLVDELILEQIRTAYAETGEFIDPEQVRTLLQEDGQAATVEVASEPPQQASRTWRISYEVHDRARSQFDTGNLAEAARTWQGLPSIERVFTISVQINCDTGSLRASFAELDDLDMPVFILPESIGGDPCYRLCAGVFDSAEEAEPFIEEITQVMPDTYPFAMSFVRR